MQGLIVLASSSPYRRQLLSRIIPHFEASEPGINECRRPGETAEKLVCRLVLEKARALAPRYPKALIIGADQVAILNAEILCKPGNHANAQRQLRLCSGQRVKFVTGLCLLDAASTDYDLVCEPYDVVFRDLSSAEIDGYLQREQPYDCAGSFKSEGLGISLFHALEGKDPNNLVGLPLITLGELLRKRGVNRWP